MMQTEETTLGAMLRVWRDRLSATDAGFLGVGIRRAAGLRREEVSERAGISVDYLVRLEQGRADHPSAAVVSALAGALQLTAAEREHLHRLAGLAPAPDAIISNVIPPGIHRLLERLADVAVAVFAADWKLLWWNRGWAALHGDPALIREEARNFARSRFPIDDATPRLSQSLVTSQSSDSVEAAIVSDLRRASGRFPHDPRLNGLIATLTARNERFAELWASGCVCAHREDHKIVEHPRAGPIELDCDVMTDGDAELKVVILTAVPGSADEAKLRALIAEYDSSLPARLAVRSSV